jgi:shikimate dehydrogenase
MRILSGRAKLAGIIGWPVESSRSPRIHNYWLEQHQIDGVYVPLAVRRGDFETAVRGLLVAGFQGANVTIPHKLAAFAVCDEVAPFAQQAGAVNTLVFRGGRIIGSNTDGPGFLAHLRAQGVDPAAGPALVLGAGGGARAIIAALLQAGAPVTITNRNKERADELAASLPGVGVIDWEKRAAALAEHVLVVNTTPQGMIGQPALELDLSRATPATVIVDIVYVPLETPLLRAAREAGLRTVDGLGMLLYQARPGFAAWFGVEPAVDARLRALVEADLIPNSISQQ